jgi:hypothetical protein
VTTVYGGGTYSVFVSKKRFTEADTLIRLPPPFTTGKSYFAQSRHLCRELSSRHSAKSFLCWAPRQALGKGLFAVSRNKAVGKEALCREQCARQRRALGKVSVHQTPAAGVPFAECQLARPSAKQSLPSVLAGSWQSIFIFLCWVFFGALCHYCKLYFKVWKKFEFFWYI